MNVQLFFWLRECPFKTQLWKNFQGVIITHGVFALQITRLWHESLKLLGLLEGSGRVWNFFFPHKGDGSHFYLKWVWVKYHSRKLIWFRRLWNSELFFLFCFDFCFYLQEWTGMIARWEKWLACMTCKLVDLSSSPNTHVECQMWFVHASSARFTAKNIWINNKQINPEGRYLKGDADGSWCCTYWSWDNWLWLLRLL